MYSRRDFLTNAAILGVAAVPALAQGGTSECAGKLPPSLAALKSRAAEAHPITVDERRQRLERARQLMQQNKLDAIFMIGGTSLIYFTGIAWWNSERLFAVVIPAKARAVLRAPGLRGRARPRAARHGPLRRQRRHVSPGRKTKTRTTRVAPGLCRSAASPPAARRSRRDA